MPLTHPAPHWTVEKAKAAGVEVIGDIELFFRQRAATEPAASVVCITGTNGKSTTTALVAHVLRRAGRDVQMGGNIGTAVLTLDPPAKDRFYVVECSSYQIDLAPSINPSAGILLNLTPDHLDRHGTMQHYADVKERLVAGSKQAIVGADDSYCSQIADRIERAGVTVTRISRRLVLKDGIFADGSRILKADGGAVSELLDLKGVETLRGGHNAQNAAAAIGACLAVGVSLDDIRSGIRSFPGLKHRMQPVGRRGHVTFVNDSKATNAEAAAPALSSYDRIYWIAGGLPKEGGITALQPLFSKIAKAYLIGEAAPQFAATLGEAVPYEISGTMDQAIAHAARDAAADATGPVAVMLSPACASFDQYKNFEVRGDSFVEIVSGLDGVTMLV